VILTLITVILTQIFTSHGVACLTMVGEVQVLNTNVDICAFIVKATAIHSR